MIRYKSIIGRVTVELGHTCFKGTRIGSRLSQFVLYPVGHSNGVETILQFLGQYQPLLEVPHIPGIGGGRGGGLAKPDEHIGWNNKVDPISTILPKGLDTK